MRIDYTEKPLSERQIVAGHLEDLLSRSNAGEIWAVSLATNERLQLVLNSQRQLCLLRGKSKILFDKRHSDFVLESMDLEEIRTSVRDAVEAVEQTAKPRLGWAYWANKITSLPQEKVKVPELVIEVKTVKQEVTVQCTLPRMPRGTTIGLEIERYVDTFYEAAYEKRKTLGEHFNGIINVEAEIKNYPKMLDRLVLYLEDMAIDYRLVGAQPGYTMAKIIVSFDEYNLAEA